MTTNWTQQPLPMPLHFQPGDLVWYKGQRFKVVNYIKTVIGKSKYHYDTEYYRIQSEATPTFKPVATHQSLTIRKEKK